MFTYPIVEHTLVTLGYEVDFDSRHHTKLKALIPMDGYTTAAVLQFREGWQNELGHIDQLFQIEWLMPDQENCLVLDINSLDDIDENPDEFAAEKILLRQIFDRILEAIANQS